MNWWDYGIGRAHDPADNASGGELGIDLSTPNNTPITCPWPATVTYAGYSASTGWIVKVLTSIPGYGSIYAYFLHMNTVDVSAGHQLTAGARVGLSGGLQAGAGGWAHVEFGAFRDSAYASRYWGFVTGSTVDPTPIIQALRNGEHTMIPAGWTDDGATLKAPNGVPVIKGFRDFVLGNAWDANNWPLLAEYYPASVEPGNPSIGPGARQDFRLSSLGWTQARGVYVIWVGQDIQAYAHALADAQTQAATLTSQLAQLQAQVSKLQADPAAAAIAALAAALKALGG